MKGLTDDRNGVNGVCVEVVSGSDLRKEEALLKSSAGEPLVEADTPT
jgi:hypothetical protein